MNTIKCNVFDNMNQVGHFASKSHLLAHRLVFNSSQQRRNPRLHITFFFTNREVQTCDEAAAACSQFTTGSGDMQHQNEN